MEEKSLLESVEILKGIEEDLDDFVWRKAQTAAALRNTGAPRTEINVDLALVNGVLADVSRARNRLERFHGWLMTEPGQAPLPYPKAVA